MQKVLDSGKLLVGDNRHIRRALEDSGQNQVAARVLLQERLARLLAPPAEVEPAKVEPAEATCVHNAAAEFDGAFGNQQYLHSLSAFYAQQMGKALDSALQASSHPTLPTLTPNQHAHKRTDTPPRQPTTPPKTYSTLAGTRRV